MSECVERVERKRLDWVDTARGIAIIAVFCGHFLTPDRRLEVFCYLFHLQLFFLISGFFFSKNKDLPFSVFLKEQIKRLIVPLVFFGVLNILFFDFYKDETSPVMWSQFASIFTGFKDHPAPELWFMASLFCVSIFYYLINKIIKNRHAILVLSLIIFLFAKVPVITVLLKHLSFLNVYDTPNYLLFFALGDYIFSHLRNFDFKAQRKKIKYFIHVIGSFLFFCAYGIFTFTPDWYKSYGINIDGHVIYNAYRLALTLIIISAVLYVSHLISDFKILSEIGKNTLVLMGLEMIIKNISLNVMGMFNISIHLDNALQIVIYCSLLIFLVKILAFNFFNKSVSYLIGK
ncbi:acyltransferase family protein [Paenibacillus sp. FSL R10-2782]|uniref:acyltransferase family protein n=1 Tax=Paenibacillus sp. FSL R10-2782 TaxID=2954661 RepID=UPI0031587559